MGGLEKSWGRGSVMHAQTVKVLLQTPAHNMGEGLERLWTLKVLWKNEVLRLITFSPARILKEFMTWSAVSWSTVSRVMKATKFSKVTEPVALGSMSSQSLSNRGSFVWGGRESDGESTGYLAIVTHWIVSKFVSQTEKARAILVLIQLSILVL